MSRYGAGARVFLAGPVFAAAAVLVLGGASCSSTKPLSGVAQNCSLNSECDQPLVCVFTRCHNACNTSVDCPSGQRCVPSATPGMNVCQLPKLEDTCSTGSACSIAGEVCGADGQCRATCQMTSCLSMQTCASNAGQSVCLDPHATLDQTIIADGGAGEAGVGPDVSTMDSGDDGDAGDATLGDASAADVSDTGTPEGNTVPEATPRDSMTGDGGGNGDGASFADGSDAWVDGSGSTGPTLPIVSISSANLTIASPTHWTVAMYVVYGDLQVNSALTVDPGSVVKFDLGRSMSVSPTGTFSASGTASAPIVFTSIRDNAQGGNTYGDASAAPPAPGDWKGIGVHASGSTFDHCVFSYAGGSDSAALELSPDGGNSQNAYSATVTNSVFAHNKGPTDGLNKASVTLSAWAAAAGTVIKNNVFYDNRRPLTISAAMSLDDSNAFDNRAAAPANPQPNEFNAIEVYGTGDYSQHIASNVTWSATSVPFRIGNPLVGLSVSLYVDTGGLLTLADNVTLKFFSRGRLSVASGARLTTGNNDVFTSIYDTADGGDTAGTGGTVMPMAGDWSGITVNGVCQTWTNILYSTPNCP